MACSGDASCRQVGGTGVEEASQVRERVLSVEGGFGAASGWASADPHSGEIGSLVRVLIPWPSLIQTSPVPFRVVLLLWKFNDSPQAFASQT